MEHVSVVGHRQFVAGLLRPVGEVILLAVALREVLLVKAADLGEHLSLDDVAKAVDEGQSRAFLLGDPPDDGRHAIFGKP